MKQFEKLESLEQNILFICAIAYEPLTPAKLSKCLTTLKIMSPKGTPYNGNLLKPVLTNLVNDKFLEFL